jgi:hypothetical protein
MSGLIWLLWTSDLIIGMVELFPRRQFGKSLYIWTWVFWATFTISTIPQVVFSTILWVGKLRHEYWDYGGTKADYYATGFADAPFFPKVWHYQYSDR